MYIHTCINKSVYITIFSSSTLLTARIENFTKPRHFAVWRTKQITVTDDPL